MTQKLLLNTQMIWKTFRKILKNIIPTKNKKKLIVFDDIIVDMFSNKKRNRLVT